MIKCNVKTEYGKQQVPVDFCQLGKGKQGANPVRSRHCKYGVHKHRIVRGRSLGNWEGRFCMLIYKPGNLPVVGTGT